jgi:ABC-2 type transport system ATP-binding protein
MKRALTIGAALIHKPKVIFLDEPTVGLDVIAARSLRNLLESLRKQEITIFLTTHYLEEADLLCDRIAILVNGKVVKIDTPKSLKAMSEKELIIECCFNREISHLIKDLIIPNAKIIALDHNKIRIYGGTSTQIYETIFLFAKNKSIEIESINSIKPSLEDAFIKTTGLSPILMKVEKAN